MESLFMEQEKRMEIEGKGVKLYYETLGSGAPLILLHGNSESHEIFNESAALLASRYTVYLLDSRGHGKSGKVDAFHYEDMAEDVELLIRTLSLEKPILCGFSDGGIVGLMLAAKYPDLLSKLIVCGANLTPNGLKKWPRLLFRLLYLLTRDEKLGLMEKEPNIGEDMLQHISVPTLVLAGSRDMICEEETRTIAKHIPNAVLRILKGESHSSYVVHSEKLAGYLLAFLKESV